MDPPRILDPIITSLSNFYQVPQCLPPLDPDPDSNGKPSDHKMVVMTPISLMNNLTGRTKRIVTFRPFSDQGQNKMKDWVSEQNWNDIFNQNCAHKKAENLQNLLVSKYEEFFPPKNKVIKSDDQPYYNEKLEKMKRRKCREYRKNRKSKKWKKMNEIYDDELGKAKKSFYRGKIRNLRTANPGKWYRVKKVN